MSVLHLASGANGDGYFHALRRTWSDTGQRLNNVVAKSSLSEFRDKVSFKFFEDIFRQGLADHQKSRRTYRGFYIYAIDGDQLELPASRNVLENGYRGWRFANKFETHYPKMYTAQVFDVVNNLITDFSQSTKIDEVHLARRMASGLEKNSITLYDRLHCGFKTFHEHHIAGSYFIVRARTTGSAHLDVLKFVRSRKTSAESIWKPRNERRTKPDLRLRLVKVRNPKTKKAGIFVTNLPANLFSEAEIGRLYQRRWDIEGSFRDLTPFTKLGQFHSTKVNGILQEIYALLWLMNAAKARLNDFNSQATDWLNEEDYWKSNLKIALSIIIENIGLLVRAKLNKFNAIFNFWMRRTSERRRRNVRVYPRVARHHGREYPYATQVPRRKI